MTISRISYRPSWPLTERCCPFQDVMTGRISSHASSDRSLGYGCRSATSPAHRRTGRPQPTKPDNPPRRLAEHPLKLRTVAANGDLDAYWKHHLAAEHERLYPADQHQYALTA
ncbi:hypothetical protein GCM10010431_59330 [Streptomyces kunmingensis]